MMNSFNTTKILIYFLIVSIFVAIVIGAYYLGTQNSSQSMVSTQFPSIQPDRVTATPTSIPYGNRRGAHW